MSRNESRAILVFDHGTSHTEPRQMGTLYSELIRGEEIFSFEYESSWLEDSSGFAVDPNLQLFSGRQYAPEKQSNFGLFLDSSPDRWGRVLMQRREAYRATQEDRPRRRLLESDFLLGVHDESRMGALRFKLDVEGPYLDHDPAYAAPPMTSLRELERAATEIQADPLEPNPDWYERIAMLIAPGSSLGGARPKASVRSADGGLWIAKFPGRTDSYDVGAWEYVAYKLAEMAGIVMSDSNVGAYLSTDHTFLTRRFDRTFEGDRIHFFSAMTLLGYRDGTNASDGVSYLDLAELLMSRGVSVDRDLEQLWRRMVFHILISNTDDHLRNHGFLIQKGGITLSPAYDINPNPDGFGLTLNINEHDNRLDPELAMEVAPLFRLSHSQARSMLESITRAVSCWRDVARECSIRNREIERMESAFRVQRG